MSGLPAKVTVGPYRYQVQVDQAAVDAASLAEHADLCGTADHLGQVISLSPKLGVDAQREVLLHECLHAIFEQASLERWLKHDVAERLIEVLGYSLLDLLRRNPELVAYLTDGHG